MSTYVMKDRIGTKYVTINYKENVLNLIRELMGNYDTSGVKDTLDVQRIKMTPAVANAIASIDGVYDKIKWVDTADQYVSDIIYNHNMAVSNYKESTKISKLVDIPVINDIDTLIQFMAELKANTDTSTIYNVPSKRAFNSNPLKLQLCISLAILISVVKPELSIHIDPTCVDEYFKTYHTYWQPLYDLESRSDGYYVRYNNSSILKLQPIYKDNGKNVFYVPVIGKIKEDMLLKTQDCIPVMLEAGEAREIRSAVQRDCQRLAQELYSRSVQRTPSIRDKLKLIE